MNRLTYILIILLLGGSVCLDAQTEDSKSLNLLPDTLSVGYGLGTDIRTSGHSISGVNAEAFATNPHIDVGKALYGKIAGLNVTQGTGSSANNISALSLHGKSPLILVDGFPRDITNITSSEIESVYVLKDAAAAALYGMRGANGVMMITTKRGMNEPMEVAVNYYIGVNTQFRAPEFADSFTYANAVNDAYRSDGLGVKYSDLELSAFKNGTFAYDYPNVDWWNETLNKTGLTHNLNMSFNGGNSRFRYRAVLDYYRDRSMLKENQDDSRYSTKPTDTRLSLRTNLDVDITKSTYLKVSLVGKLQETNGTRYGAESIFTDIYYTPSAAFPVKYQNGVYGGSSVYGAKNPVALLKDYGHRRVMYGTLLADLTLTQKLDVITDGLSAEAAVSFDNVGSMNEASSKTYAYMNSYAQIASDGTLITTPQTYSVDSETLGHSQSFQSLMLRSDFQGRLKYDRNFGKNDLTAALVYEMQSTVNDGRNKSTKNQSMLFNAAYSYDNRYSIDAVANLSGSSYLPDGSKFEFYPAASAAWTISNEGFMSEAESIDLLKLRTSYGLSGWDGNLTHELWRQSYGSSGTTYYFGTNASGNSGASEGALPVVGLVAEKSAKANVGLDLRAFSNKLSATVDAYYDQRSNVLVSGSTTTSGIIGVEVGNVNEGEYDTRGIDFTLNWEDKIGHFGYALGANISYMETEIINENQAYQQYDYLYTKGNPVGQSYGLEAIGFFASQQEINNSPRQTFSTVVPGDIKYKDQNGDNVIDDNDVVKMFGSSQPRCYFGFNLNLSYKRLELTADFQGLTGKTVSLLGSPLYKPLVNNGNISQTFLDSETYWTEDNRAGATMPRLTTLGNANNYRASSLWYRDASFIKLRNLLLSYTFPKAQTKFATMKVYVQGTNLFSLDNLGFADPEQLSAAYPSVRSFWAGIKFDF